MVHKKVQEKNKDSKKKWDASNSKVENKEHETEVRRVESEKAEEQFMKVEDNKEDMVALSYLDVQKGDELDDSSHAMSSKGTNNITATVSFLFFFS